MNRGFILLLVLGFLFGGAAVLWLRTGNSPPPAQPPVIEPAPAETAPAPEQRFLILAASWQPAFCEGARNKQECRTQTASRYDATHFALHGLWPQADYCDVSSVVEQRDRDGRWSQLRPVDLPPALQTRLNERMPGTRSQLERHEWTKHGTCYGANEVVYFADALALMDALNGSAVQKLFADNIGRELTQARIRQAFDDAFGVGAGERVRVACDTDGSRELISELTIGLYAAPGDKPDLGEWIFAARPTRGGCLRGIVDPAGLQ
ncbi:ribonuclease T2 family protein [Devosia sp.]|uniref:ribonuclease T2 family protein n=1 Tax=Devosia sp. TaxID=1871048 RepID=UPI003A944983